MWVVFYVEDCGVNIAEYLVHSMHMNRLNACREFCGVHSWQNGMSGRDGVKVLWCHWFPCSLVGFWGFHDGIPTCACFPEWKHFCNLFLLLLLLLFFYCRLEKRKMGREAEGKMYGLWTMIIYNFLFRTKNHHKFKIVKLYIQASHFFIYGGLETRAKCLKTQVQSTWVLHELINSPLTSHGLPLGSPKKYLQTTSP